MTLDSRLTMTQRIFAGLLCAGLLGGVSAPSSAADFGRAPGHGVKRVHSSRLYWDWRARCAYAGYYCLYYEYGYVYHYPFDDRPIAYGRYRRRYR